MTHHHASGAGAVTSLQPGQIKGRHLAIHLPNLMGFEQETEMLLEHVDPPEFAGSVVILGDEVLHPAAPVRERDPGSGSSSTRWSRWWGRSPGIRSSGSSSTCRGADEIRDDDPRNVEYLGRYGVRVDRVIPMRCTGTLRRLPASPHPVTDVLVGGSMNDRRYGIFTDLQRWYDGRVTMARVFGFRGPGFDRALADANILLNLHAVEPWHRQEQTRIFYPLINGNLVISEVSEATWFGDATVDAPESELGSTILRWLEDDRCREFGPTGSARFGERSQD
jgi:hypothetical protein